MQTTESCKLCEKIVVTLESTVPLKSSQELPNTFDSKSKKYTWKRHDLMAFALIPRTVHGTTGQIDFFVCIEEDDLDDIDLFDYACKFLWENVFPSWKNFKDAHVLQPSLSTPAEIGCWKVQHKPQEERE